MIKVEFPFNFLCLNLKERQIFSLEIIEQAFFLITLFLGFFFIIFFFVYFFKYTFVTLCKNSRAHPTVMAHRHKQTSDYLNRHNPQ